MLRPEVVQYLRANLPKYSVEALRRQLREEGVSEIDFEHCLADALRGPKSMTPLKKKAPARAAARFALTSGVVLAVGVGLFALSRKPAVPTPSTEPTATTGSGESGFVGADGWVLRLPKDYAGFAGFRGSNKAGQIVHFAKRGTDPTNFLDEGLYGPMGIVRLEVAPSPFPANTTGAANLANAVRNKTAAHGEKYEMKTIRIGTLPGVQITIQAPFPRVEAYILGQNNLYFFYGGQEDDVWRDIVLSLRDAHAEE